MIAATQRDGRAPRVAAEIAGASGHGRLRLCPVGGWRAWLMRLVRMWLFIHLSGPNQLVAFLISIGWRSVTFGRIMDSERRTLAVGSQQG
jgi:hypothetical protein